MISFEELIHDLGTAMGIELAPDQHHSCLLTFPPNSLRIQIDLSAASDQVLLGSHLGELRPGPYRERVLLQAMRANGSPIPSARGTLAFSEKKGTLVLFQFFPLSSLNGEKLYAHIQVFRDHASLWKEALERGDVPQITQITGASDPLFGLVR